MKTCTYCGRENTEPATHCAECGTDQFKVDRGEAASISEASVDWATVSECRTLIDADQLAMQLEGAGVEAFIPDASLMQQFSLFTNPCGFVRVQVAREDLEHAKEILASPPVLMPPPLPPMSPSFPGEGVG